MSCIFAALPVQLVILENYLFFNVLNVNIFCWDRKDAIFKEEK